MHVFRAYAIVRCCSCTRRDAPKARARHRQPEGLVQTPLVAGHRTHLITQVSQHVEAIVFYQRFVHLMRQTAPQPARVKEVDEALVAVFVASYRRQSERLTHLRLLLSAKGQVDVCERLPTVHPRRNASAPK